VTDFNVGDKVVFKPVTEENRNNSDVPDRAGVFTVSQVSYGMVELVERPHHNYGWGTKWDGGRFLLASEEPQQPVWEDVDTRLYSEVTLGTLIQAYELLGQKVRIQVSKK
jgi:hypothetical protein